MTYRIWTNKVDKDSDFTEAKIRDVALLKAINLTGGVSLEKIWSRVVIDVMSEYAPADSFLCGPMLIVSRKLADVIFKFVSKNDLEFLPVDVVFQEKLQAQYGFLNVCLACDALDKSRSKFTEMDGMVDSIDRIYLDELSAKHKPIFRLDSIEWVLCVHELLVERIEKEKFSGVVFKSETEWRSF